MKNVRIKGFPIVKGEVKDGAIIEIPVPTELNELALSRDSNDWDKMCNSLPNFGFMNPISKMHITHLIIDGVEKRFH